MSLPHRLVRAATYVLPRGTVRERYRDELEAELHDLEGPARLRHALGFATRVWALRRAVSGSQAVGGLAPRPVPWHCRLHLWHHDRMAFTEDGGRYRRCADCGRDNTRGGSRANDSAAWAATVYPPG